MNNKENTRYWCLRDYIWKPLTPEMKDKQRKAGQPSKIKPSTSPRIKQTKL